MLWNEETEGRDRVCFTHRLKRCCTRSCSTFELLCFHLDSTQQKWQLRNTQPCSRVCTLTVCWYQTEMQTESPNTCFSCTNRRATLCLNKSVKTQTQSLPHRRAHFLSLKETNIILFLHAHAHTQKKKKSLPVSNNPNVSVWQSSPSSSEKGLFVWKRCSVGHSHSSEPSEI